MIMSDVIERTVVNGIDVTSVGEVIEAIQADPAHGRVRFGVDTRWTGGTASVTRVSEVVIGGERIERDFTIATDEPTELLGGNTAPNPQELLMAAVNACMTVGYVAGAAGRGIRLSHLAIRMIGELDLRGFLALDDEIPAGYETLDYEVEISGDACHEAFEDLHRAVMATSPNYFNMARPIRMNGSLRVR
jgi:uncharacterized OsmC-like protein